MKKRKLQSQIIQYCIFFLAFAVLTKIAIAQYVGDRELYIPRYDSEAQCGLPRDLGYYRWPYNSMALKIYNQQGFWCRVFGLFCNNQYEYVGWFKWKLKELTDLEKNIFATYDQSGKDFDYTNFFYDYKTDFINEYNEYCHNSTGVFKEGTIRSRKYLAPYFEDKVIYTCASDTLRKQYPEGLKACNNWEFLSIYPKQLFNPQHEHLKEIIKSTANQGDRSEIQYFDNLLKTSLFYRDAYADKYEVNIKAKRDLNINNNHKIILDNSTDVLNKTQNSNIYYINNYHEKSNHQIHLSKTECILLVATTAFGSGIIGAIVCYCIGKPSKKYTLVAQNPPFEIGDKIELDNMTDKKTKKELV